MGYLTSRDYEKIRKLIETFLDNPMLIENLFKTLVLFLETKNVTTITIPKENIQEISSSPKSYIKVQKELKRANKALNKFSDRLLKESAKKRKYNKIAK